LTLCLCDRLCFCCTILCHCRWTFLCPCPFHLWRKEKESFALQLVSLFFLVVAISRTSPWCACAQCPYPCSTATYMGESCFAVEMHMSPKLLWLHPRKRVSTYLVFFVTFMDLVSCDRVCDVSHIWNTLNILRNTVLLHWRSLSVMKGGAETSYFAALEVKYSRLEERTSGKCTSENVLPKNLLLKTDFWK
jgi:hypothetical protein